MKITLHERASPTPIQDLAHLDQLIAQASRQAQEKGILSMVILKADNGNELSLVVGGDETVLGFTGAHLDPPYYASKGKDEGDGALMVCFLFFEHHTEFPRPWVIPFPAGLCAVHEFYRTGRLPACIEWVEV